MIFFHKKVSEENTLCLFKVILSLQFTISTLELF